MSSIVTFFYQTIVMKKILILLSLLLPIVGMAQVTFSEQVVDSSSAAIGINKIVPLDFNMDGYLDIAVTITGVNDLLLYENIPNAAYGQGVVIDNQNFAIDLCSADFDANGYPDLASFSLFDDSIYVYLNSNGIFNTKISLTAPSFSPVQLHTYDFNLDGSPDLLAIDDTVTYIYYNDGTANFTRTTLAGDSEYYSGQVTDINGDSLPDVVLGSVGLFTYLNNGDGTFFKDPRNETLINDFVFEIEFSDIDLDGDQDMAIFYSNTNSRIDWYENDSTGQFSLAGSITTSADDVKSMRFADFNSDGLHDFVTTYQQSGALVWMENLGAGMFGPENVLKTYPVLSRQVAVGDVEADGDIDIFFSHNIQGLRVWENNSVSLHVEEMAITTTLYPNPTKSSFSMVCPGVGFFLVTSLDGKIVVPHKDLKPGVNLIRFCLQSGVYVVRGMCSGKEFRQQLIVVE